MKREHVFVIFFFVALLFLVYQFCLILSVFVTPLSWAALLALVFYPVQRRLAALIGGREGLSSFLLTTAAIAFVIVPTIYLVSIAATQSVGAYNWVQEQIQSGRATETVEQLRGRLLGVLSNYLPSGAAGVRLDLPAIALKLSQVTSAFLVANVSDAAANILISILNFFLTTLILFFFLRDGRSLVAYLRNLIPMETQYRDMVLDRLSETLSAVVIGMVVTATAQGALAALAYWVLDVRFSVLLGFATAILSLLPGGPIFIWLPVSGYFAIQGSWGSAIGLVAWSVLVVGTADNVLRPLIIGGRVQIPTLLLLLGILGGLQVYGFLGLFLGPVLIATLVTFLRIYSERYLQADAAAPAPAPAPPPAGPRRLLRRRRRK